ncbi:MAG TPA: magnesium transporter CorA family protein [Anaerolineales bacterium]|nr:magnesium transporter CorA family protein [Anaerolineales bacterium]
MISIPMGPGVWSFQVLKKNAFGDIEMMTIYKTAGNELETIDRPSKGSWVNLVDPSADELRQTAQDLDIDPEMLRFSMGQEAISSVKKVDDTLRILIRIPYHQAAEANVPYITLPLGIVLTKDLVITVCREEVDLFQDLDDAHREDLATDKPRRFVLHMLLSNANAYLRFLNDIYQSVDRLEEHLVGALQNREVLELLRYQKSLVYFMTGLEFNGMMLDRLQRAELLDLKPADADLVDDVVTENLEAQKMVENASNILSQMMAAFSSIISNNLNVVMKFMAAITVILIIPQIVGAFYGMNVGLPIENHSLAFLIIVGLSFLMAAVVAWIFRKKNWM